MLFQLDCNFDNYKGSQRAQTSIKIHQNLMTTVGVMLLTDKLTNKPWQKHDLLCRGNMGLKLKLF